MRPFFVFFVAAWAGGIVGGLGGWPQLAVVFSAAAAVMVGYRRVPTATAGAVVLLTALGAALGWQARPQVAPCAASAELVGTVTERPQMRPGWQRLVVIDRQRCRTLVLTERWQEFSVGDTVVVAGGASERLAETAAFSEGYAAYLAQRGIQSSRRWARVTVQARGSDRFYLLYTQLRRRVQKIFAEPDAGVATALLLGESTTPAEDVLAHFRRSGVSHVLSVSGLHISLIAGTLAALTVLLPLTATMRAGLLLAGLWGYIFLIGAPVAAVRSAWFWTLTVAALRLRAVVGLLTVLVVTVLLLVSADPRVLFDVGFQLSAAAVVGIFAAHFVARRRQPVAGASRVALLWQLVLVSAGAGLATAPLVAYHFGTISPGGLLANLIVVPASSVLLLLAAVALLLSYVWLPLGLLAAYVFHLLFGLTDTVMEWIGELPGVYVEGVRLSAPAVVLCYVLAGGVFGFLVHRRRAWRELWV